MDNKTLKQLMRMLKKLYAELEEQALSEGIDLASEEFEQLRDKVRSQLLGKHGYTIEEYQRAKEKLKELKEVVMKGDRGEDGHTPTDEELTALIKPLILQPKDGKDGKTPTKEDILAVVKPLIKEPKNGITPSDERLMGLIEPLLPSYEAELGYLEDKINNLPQVDVEALKENISNGYRQFFQDNFSENFKKNIDIFGMPDFRKLAMGLRQDIDDIPNLEVNNQTGTTYTLQPSDNNKMVDVSNGSAITVTVPNNLGIPIGAQILIKQGGAGAITVSAGSGATVSVNGNLTAVTNGQHAVAGLIKVSSSTWIIFGNLVAA